MRVWSMQPLEVYNEIMKKGYYVCNPKKSELIREESNFRIAYNWLIKEMVKRIGYPPKGVQYPVWAWAVYNGRNHKPDLRTGQLKPGQEGVCIELEIPENQLVLSDFDAWHSVLNDSFSDTSKNEMEWEKQHDWFDSLPYEERQIVKEKSWQNIFNIEPYESDWVCIGKYVQATFWVLRKEDIKKVQFFKSR